LPIKISSKICAVIWDYDGTLVDSRQKNFNVTKKILKKIAGDYSGFQVLSSINNYTYSHLKATNWREFYRDEFNLTDEEIDKAGRLWTEYQLSEDTKVPIINGLGKVIKLLKKLPQGIVSQNSKENIIKNIKKFDLGSYFSSIIGYEEVDLRKQKPDPEGLLICIRQLCESNAGIVFYIGDHETDLETAKRANQYFGENKIEITVSSIAAAYSEYFKSISSANNFDYIADQTDINQLSK
jgi:HAD superfamily hydrolase (TIGR01549 family)